jgi:tRNA A37 methylthiotransferase MiaB
MRRANGLSVAPGARVRIHQAFKCCPYAGMITSRIHDYVERNGLVVVGPSDPADVHVINTCGSDASQAQLTFDALDRAGAEPVVVTGCLASIEPKRLLGALEGRRHALFDPRNLDGLDEVFAHDAVAFDDVHPSLKNQYSGTEFATGWYHVGVSTGCFGKCTFCAIRRATGRPKSTPIPAILEDIDRGVAQGHEDVLLVSTDVSAWGADLGLTVVDLLGSLVAPGFQPGVLYSAESFEPTLFLAHLDALLPIFATGRFAWIGLPLQSGSQRILDVMKREHRVSDVLDAVRRLREAAPDLVIRTDILYGFADETDEELEESIAASRHFDVPRFNHYQERPGTAPAQLGADVLAARRERVMREMADRARQGFRPVKRRAPLAADTVEVPVPPDPWADWRTEQLARFRRALARPLELGRGWTIASARDDEGLQGLVLELRHPAEGAFDVALRHPKQPGSYLTVTRRFAVWVPGSDRPTEGGQRALKALVEALAR